MRKLVCCLRALFTYYLFLKSHHQAIWRLMNALCFVSLKQDILKFDVSNYLQLTSGDRKS